MSRIMSGIWIILSMLTASLWTTNVYASQGDPLTEILDILEEMESTQTKMSNDTGNISTNTKDQLNELKSEWAKLTQSYGMSDTSSDQSARLWSADDWNSVLQQASGGNNARFQQLMQSYSQTYPSIQANQTTSIDPKALVDTTYAQQSENDNAGLSASAYTYDDINNQINKIETLLAEVDGANKNQNEKAAMDLNSRLVAELSFIQLEMLKMQSIRTQVETTKDQSDLNDDTLDKQFVHYKP